MASQIYSVSIFSIYLSIFTHFAAAVKLRKGATQVATMATMATNPEVIALGYIFSPVGETLLKSMDVRA